MASGWRPAALAAVAEDDEAFVIGGATIFRECIPFARRGYITRVLIDCDGDTRLDVTTLLADWRLVTKSDIMTSHKTSMPYCYEEYERHE